MAAAVCLLGWPLHGQALALGDINLKSALNQRLLADIAVAAATAEELETLSIKVADADTFARYGVDRAAFLHALQFELIRDAAGRPVLQVTSREPIREPFVTMLLEVVWSQGRLLREYTVFVDPPVLLPEPAGPAFVQSAQASGPTSITTREGEAQAVARPSTTERAGDRVDESWRASASADPAAPPVDSASLAASPSSAGETYGPVRRGDSLWSIAQRVRPGTGVSVTQVMLAIYRANLHAFGGNMNLLYRDAVLRIPGYAEIEGTDAASASAMLRSHDEAWQARRAPSAPVDPQPRLVLREPVETTVEAAAAGPGNLPGSADSRASEISQSEVLALRAEIEENRRLIQLRDSELQALQARLWREEAAFKQRTIEQQEISGAPGVDLASESSQGVEPPTSTATAASTLSRSDRAAYVVTTGQRKVGMFERLPGWIASPWLWATLGTVLGLAAWPLRSRLLKRGATGGTVVRVDVRGRREVRPKGAMPRTAGAAVGGRTVAARRAAAATR